VKHRSDLKTAALIVILATSIGASVPPPQKLPSAFDAGWKGQRVCIPLFENATMRAARCTFPPGDGHDRHYHPPHWGYIIEGGTMRITTAAGTRERTLVSGANWWSDGIDWHEAINIGTTTSVYVIVEPKFPPTALASRHNDKAHKAAHR
jgi:beta-alanine degradation protein BauB